MPGQAVVTIGAHRWAVSFASTCEELTAGLGGVPALPVGIGMLFDLGRSQAVRVTTVPMLFPLDIVFLDADARVVDLALGVSPGLILECRTQGRYFLEVNAGEAAGVQAGEQAVIVLASGESGLELPGSLDAAVDGTTGMVQGLLAMAMLAIVGRLMRGWMAMTAREMRRDGRQGSG